MMSHMVHNSGLRGCQASVAAKLEGAAGVAAVSQDGAEESGVYKTEEFRMYCFKVLPCSKRFCHDWTKCPFAHPGEKARRRDPRMYRYTGIACPEMKTGKHCPRSTGCPFAHNVFEYWLHPSRYRTQPCNDGATCARKVCFFAHTLEELRVPSSSPCGSELGTSKPGNDSSSNLLSVAEEVDTCNKENYGGGDSFETTAQTSGMYMGNARNATHGLKVGKPINLEKKSVIHSTPRRIAREHQNVRQGWEQEIPNWSMSGASDGRSINQGRNGDDISSLTRILRDMGINGGMAEEYTNYQAQNQMMFQGEIPGSNSFGPFPQMQPSRSPFSQADNHKGFHYPELLSCNTNIPGRRSDLTGSLVAEGRALSPRRLRSTGNSFHNRPLGPGYEHDSSPLQISQNVNLEGHGMFGSVFNDYFPCYNLSDGILGQSSWSRRLHEEIVYNSSGQSTQENWLNPPPGHHLGQQQQHHHLPRDPLQGHSSL